MILLSNYVLRATAVAKIICFYIESQLTEWICCLRHVVEIREKTSHMRCANMRKVSMNVLARGLGVVIFCRKSFIVNMVIGEETSEQIHWEDGSGGREDEKYEKSVYEFQFKVLPFTFCCYCISQTIELFVARPRLCLPLLIHSIIILPSCCIIYYLHMFGSHGMQTSFTIYQSQLDIYNGLRRRN